MLRIAAIATALLLATTPLAFAQEEEIYADIERIHGDADGFFELFATLQDAILFGDPVTIAQYALYPLAVNDADGNYEIIDEDDFLENFDIAFSPEAQDALGQQDIADLIVNWNGVGIGNGAIWITNVCLDDSCEETRWGILSINN